GSWLIRPDLRRHVHVFYSFARGADDIADNPDLSADDKVARLARMGEIILGQGNRATEEAESAACVRMRESLAETGVTPQHSLDLLKAFTQDALKTRYRDWNDLLAYCFLSAAPIGRHLLDLHGEGPACRPAADALCNALQVVNHLQDCGDDYRNLDRVYIPEADLAAEGATVAELGRDRLMPGLRRTLDRVIRPLEGLIEECRDIVRLVDDTRIALECQVIRAMCVRLTERLKAEDPLATRVVLSKPASAMLALGAVVSGLIARRGRPAGAHPVLAS
ncbi:MAG TPA: squalene/phytoene synthase family protein, partial [Stellaceae bacterium]|nr:squalene/phytoene synthase family protein [Stellaceae bacterium]